MHGYQRFAVVNVAASSNDGFTFEFLVTDQHEAMRAARNWSADEAGTFRVQTVRETHTVAQRLNCELTPGEFLPGSYRNGEFFAD